MKPTNFEQATKQLKRPASMTDEECGALHVWTDGYQCVSCWKPSMHERIRIMFGRPVWMGVISGRTQPPVFLEAGRNIFEPKSKAMERFTAWWRTFADDLSIAWCNIKQGFKQEDKRKHFVAGMIIAFVIGIIHPLLGFAAGCIAGALKEWWDSYGHGSVELTDFVFTCMGSVLGAVASIWFHNLIF